MISPRPFIPIYLILLLTGSLLITDCRRNKNQSSVINKGGTICVVLAHPDDETIIGGTLAILEEWGFKVHVLYVTSGDEGSDETGRGLHGNSLAEVREAEAQNALKVLHIDTPPVFLRYADGYVHENVESVQTALKAILDGLEPQMVIGFGPDGITGNWDHKFTGAATDSVFDQTEYGKLLLHMAVTKPLPPYYANGVPVPGNDIDVQVKVSKYFKQRIQTVEAHQTQFNRGALIGYKLFVHTMRFEKFIVARNRDSDLLLESCFK